MTWARVGGWVVLYVESSGDEGGCWVRWTEARRKSGRTYLSSGRKAGEPRELIILYCSVRARVLMKEILGGYYCTTPRFEAADVT